eukprot:42052-Prymnesium_polylepis.1
MASAAVMQLAAGPKAGDECANESALQARFYPYDYNGGTVLAIAGPDYAIVAGDTRMSTGFNIKSRNVSKIFEVAPGTMLATGGFRGDITTLQKLLRAKVTQYAHRHRESMKPHSVAQVRDKSLPRRVTPPFHPCARMAAGCGRCATRHPPPPLRNRRAYTDFPPVAPALVLRLRRGTHPPFRP